MSPATRAAVKRYQEALRVYGPDSSLPELAYYGPLPSKPDVPASAYKGKHAPKK